LILRFVIDSISEHQKKGAARAGEKSGTGLAKVGNMKQLLHPHCNCSLQDTEFPSSMQGSTAVGLLLNQITKEGMIIT